MNILLTNDDGYNSCGLALLAEKLSSKGHDVYVVAPDGQRSAFSHAINLRHGLIIKRLDNFCGAKVAMTCSGTPADCVKFAANHLGVNFDALISGPNNGENYGLAVAYSGTVGAAEEGVICGIKSIALSRLRWNPDGGSFHSTVEYLINNLDDLLSCCSPNSLLNINVPNLPTDEIKGVKVCESSLARLFNDVYVQQENGEWKAFGERRKIEDEDTDIVYCERGYITVTPISIRRCHQIEIDNIKRLEK